MWDIYCVSCNVSGLPPVLLVATALIPRHIFSAQEQVSRTRVVGELFIMNYDNLASCTFDADDTLVNSLVVTVMSL